MNCEIELKTDLKKDIFSVICDIQLSEHESFQCIILKIK